MDYEVSFSNPHRIFFSEDKKEELEVSYGDPVEIQFEGVDTQIVVKASNISEIEKLEELHSIFFSLHYCMNDIEEVHGKLFQEFNQTEIDSDSVFNDTLNEHADLREYLKKIKHYNDYRFSETDVVIGCGLADLVVKAVDEKSEFEKLFTPFSSYARETMVR